MNKKLYLATALLVGAIGAGAAPLTPQQALQRVSSSQKMRKVKGVSTLTKDLLYTYPSANGEAAVYVFGDNGRKGYILLSADDAMAPVLGYADSGEFDAENMPPQMEEWLAGYARQQEYARQMGLPEYKAPADDSRQAVAPLMKTAWNQNYPYNLYTPAVNGEQCPTGCVATAMAQVMKYWNYPEAAVGSGSITNPSTNITETMIFGEENFAWNDMLDSYSGKCDEFQEDAVAYLMKACGYSVQMSYSLSVSGSFSVYAAKAFIDNFQYNPNIRYYQRDYFEATQWDEIVYNEVASGRPVLYGAQSTSGGHEFVCDGYSGDGYYHFNWGWGGMSDGYFILDSLNPGAIGTGGGLGGGFNYKQDIIVGIQPEPELVYEPRLIQYGQLSATASGLKLTLRIRDNGSISQWVNTGLDELKEITIGAAVETVNKEGDPLYLSGKSQRVPAPEYKRVENGLNIAYSGINGQFSVEIPGDLADGKYKVTVSTLNGGSNAWVPVLTQENTYNYMYITKKGENLEVESLEEAYVTLDSYEPLTPVYYGSLATFAITVTNHGDKEMTNGFYPELYLNGKLCLVGDGIVLTLQPNETVTKEFTTQFRVTDNGSAPVVATPYELKWKNPNNNTYYNEKEEETLVVNVSLVNPELKINKFEIDGASTVSEDVPGAGEMDVYQVTDAANIKAVADVTCSRGYFGYAIYMAVFDTDELAQGIFNNPVMQALCEPMQPLEVGDSCEVTADVNMSGGVLGKIYACMLFYQSPKGMVQIQTNPICFKLTNMSGVEEIDGTDTAAPVYYNLQGREVMNPQKGDLLIKKQGNKTVKIIF